MSVFVSKHLSSVLPPNTEMCQQRGGKHCIKLIKAIRLIALCVLLLLLLLALGALAESGGESMRERGKVIERG